MYPDFYEPVTSTDHVILGKIQILTKPLSDIPIPDLKAPLGWQGSNFIKMSLPQQIILLIHLLISPRNHMLLGVRLYLN